MMISPSVRPTRMPATIKVSFTRTLRSAEQNIESPLDDVRKRFFHAAEIERAGDQNYDCSRSRYGDYWTGCGIRAQQSPAKTFDYADHWIQSVDRPPGLMEQTAGIRNRRHEQPELGDEWDYVAHVAVFDVQRRQPQTYTQ